MKNSSIKTSNQKSSSLASERLDFIGNNLSGTTIGDSYVVKSYGYYPLFVYKSGIWYENKDKYSSSTSKQKTQVRPTHKTVELTTDEMKRLY